MAISILLPIFYKIINTVVEMIVIIIIQKIQYNRESDNCLVDSDNGATGGGSSASTSEADEKQITSVQALYADKGYIMSTTYCG